MRKFKKVLLLLLFLLGMLFIAVTSFFYFLNINDYSEWISEQVKITTGYDVRFDRFENNWFEEKGFSFVGLSLYQQEQRVALIKQLDIKIESLDLWQRELDIESIKLNGVEVNLLTPLKASEVDVKAVSAEESGKQTTNQNKISELTAINWEKLHLATFEITNLNASLRHQDKSLSVKKANLRFHDLLIINHQQLQTLPATLDISSAFESLLLSSEKQNVEINHFNLTTNAELAQRKGNLSLSAEKVKVDADVLPPIEFKKIELLLKLEQNKLSLQRLFFDAFSGSIEVIAEASLQIKVLPKPAINVKKLELLSLDAQDMSIVIPQWQSKNEEGQPSSIQQPLPIEELIVKEARLQNISVSSETLQLPLILKSVDLQVKDLLVVKDNQLVNPTEDKKQAGTAAIEFEYLRWQDVIIEQFSAQGSLFENQDLSLLRQLLEE